MSNKIKLVVGDWSHDGHEMTETIAISSNLTNVELQDAYRKGTKKVKFDFQKTVATEYEEDILKKDLFDKLVNVHGMKLDLDVDYDEEGEQYVLTPISYAEIWLFIASLGNEEFRYKIINDEFPRLCIGGYGLFFS